MNLQETPAGDTLIKTRKLANRLESDPRLRRAIAAMLKVLRQKYPEPPPSE